MGLPYLLSSGELTSGLTRSECGAAEPGEGRTAEHATEDNVRCVLTNFPVCSWSRVPGGSGTLKDEFKLGPQSLEGIHRITRRSLAVFWLRLPRFNKSFGVKVDGLIDQGSAAHSMVGSSWLVRSPKKCRYKGWRRVRGDGNCEGLGVVSTNSKAASGH